MSWQKQTFLWLIFCATSQMTTSDGTVVYNMSIQINGTGCPGPAINMMPLPYQPTYILTENSCITIFKNNTFPIGLCRTNAGNETFIFNKNELGANQTLYIKDIQPLQPSNASSAACSCPSFINFTRFSPDDLEQICNVTAQYGSFCNGNNVSYYALNLTVTPVTCCIKPTDATYTTLSTTTPALNYTNHSTTTPASTYTTKSTTTPDSNNTIYSMTTLTSTYTTNSTTTPDSNNTIYSMTTLTSTYTTNSTTTPDSNNTIYSMTTPTSTYTTNSTTTPDSNNTTLSTTTPTSTYTTNSTTTPDSNNTIYSMTTLTSTYTTNSTTTPDSNNTIYSMTTPTSTYTTNSTTTPDSNNTIYSMTTLTSTYTTNSTTTPDSNNTIYSMTTLTSTYTTNSTTTPDSNNTIYSMTTPTSTYTTNSTTTPDSNNTTLSTTTPTSTYTTNSTTTPDSNNTIYSMTTLTSTYTTNSTTTPDSNNTIYSMTTPTSTYTTNSMTTPDSNNTTYSTTTPDSNNTIYSTTTPDSNNTTLSTTTPVSGTTTPSMTTVSEGMTASKALQMMDELEEKIHNMTQENKTTEAIIKDNVKGLIYIQDPKKEPEDMGMVCSSDQDNLTINENQNILQTKFSWYVKISKEAFNKSSLENNGSTFVGILQFKNMNINVTDKHTLLKNEMYGITMGANISNLTDNIEILIRSEIVSSNATCNSWSGKGEVKWTTFGCDTKIVNNLIQCSCSHLTFFAVLMSMPDSNITAPYVGSLTYITYIGCGLSMFFLGIALFMHFLLRKNRSNHATKILINMFVALFLLNLSFLSNENIANTQNKSSCVFIALIMHYSMLATFTWFFLQALHMYLWLIRQTVKIKNYMRKITVSAWVFPSPVVIIIASIGEYKSIKISSTSQMCWIENIYIHYIVNIGYYSIVFCFTSGIFIMIVTKIIQARNVKVGDVKRLTFKKQMLMILSLFLLFGLTWGVAFFSYGNMIIPSYYIFTVLNSFQGFFLFLYYYHIRNDFEDGFSEDPDRSSSTATITQSTISTAEDNLYS
ncbi:uncharacterized protein [Misgurnus anguillicaudatus]|uniref:uncharacterized protein isoform X1 n=1 Tax=Misgurnus anguillicaudatus TaxID=75329 RepID=UPI003CCFAE94